MGETDFTYRVTAPGAAGHYSFSGVLTNSDREEVPIGGALTITVGTPAARGVIRSFSPPSAAPGGVVVVTITASGYGGFGWVVETLPPGFSYVSSSLSDDSVTVNEQEVDFHPFGGN